MVKSEFQINSGKNTSAITNFAIKKCNLNSIFPFQKMFVSGTALWGWGLLNQARPSNISLLNYTIMNDRALDLTLGSITGYHIMAHNNYGRVQNDDQIFRQIKTPYNLIERTTSNDGKVIYGNALRQQSNQPAQTVGQSSQFADQSIQSVQHAGQSLQYIQPTQARDFTCQGTLLLLMLVNKT